MKTLILVHLGRRLRVVRLGFTIWLAMLFVAVLLCGLREGSPAYAASNNLYVDGSIGNDIPACGTLSTPCETISYTLNSQASDGDFILVSSGTYTENLTITSITVTLRGGYTISGTQWLTDTGETVIDGGDADRVFFIHGSNAILENLTITGGDAPPAEPWGAGLWVTDGDVTIRSSNITGNGNLNNSMGIEVNDDFGPSHLTLESSTVSYNSGSGLHVYSGSGGASVEVRKSTFFSNTSGNGGGIAVERCSSVVIEDSYILSNTATLGGGVWINDNCTATIMNNQIVSNTAYEGGGGLYALGVTMTLLSNDFLSNTSHNDEGPAIWVNSSALFAGRNLFAYNVSNASWGGGAVRLNLITTTLVNNIAVRNQAGGFQLTQSNVSFINNTIVSNTLNGIGFWDGSIVPLLRNNIVADNGLYGVAGDGILSLSEYNDLWNNLSGSYDVPTITLGTGNLALDPQFEDAATDDYHLRAGSPCIDAATSTGAPGVDFEGDLRPLDGDLDGTDDVDIGADEFEPYHIYLSLVLKN